MKQRSWSMALVLCLVGALSLIGAELVWPQEPVGIVTALQGTVQLTRPALPAPVGLRFKDGLHVRDVVDTQEQALVRILFGGKSTVTVRELSRLEVREEALPGGGTLSVHELASGSILVNVARRLLRPGDEVQIRTPNAVAAVRGTTISARYHPESARCVFTVLTGSAVIMPLRGSPFILSPNTAVTVTGGLATDVQAGAVQAITPTQANQVMQDYAVRPVIREAAHQEQTGQAQLETATQLATLIASSVSSEAMPTPAATPTSAKEVAPADTTKVVPEAPPAAVGGVSSEAMPTPTTAPTSAKEVAPADTTKVVPKAPPATVEGVSSEAMPMPAATPTSAKEATPADTTKVVPKAPRAAAKAAASIPTPMASDQPMPEEPPSEPPPAQPPAPTGGKITLTGTLTSTEPRLQVTAPLVLSAPASLFEVPAGDSANMAGPLLAAQDTTLDLGANALLVEGSLTSATPQALFAIDPSTVTIGGSLVVVPARGSFTAAGPLADLTETTLTIAGGPIILVEDRGSLKVTSNDTTPWLNLKASVLSSATSLFDLQHARMTLAGPVIRVGQQSRLSHGTGPVLRLTDGSLSADSLMTTDGTGNQLTLVGSLLDLANATVTLRTLLSVPASGSDTVRHLLAAGEPLVRLTDSTLTLTGSGVPFIQFGSDTGASTAQRGVGLIASSSTLSTKGALLTLAGVTLLDAMPQLQLTATTVTQTGAQSLIEVGGPPSQLTGSLLEATNSTVSTSAGVLHVQDTTLTTASSSRRMPNEGVAPLFQFEQSMMNGADSFAGISGTLALNGPLVHATDSMLTTGGDFIILGTGGRLSGASSQALVQLTESSLRAFTLLFNKGGAVDLVGMPILNAVNSFLTFDSAIIESDVGAQISSGTTAPLIALNGGRLTSHGHLFVLRSNAFDSTTNLVAPLQTGGVLLEATNGAAVNSAGHALRLDTALLQATMPILHLIGSPTRDTVLTSGDSTMDLFKSHITSMGPVVALDKGIINVTNGPLLRLADGSTMLVTGDLLQLLNGSKINVVNGPLILVTGNGSLLNVNGALVSFGGTGGNQIVVNNTIAPTADASGIPVSATTGGSITIGPAPITNPHLGSVTVSPGGSAIQATNGGAVTIAAPGGPTN